MSFDQDKRKKSGGIVDRVYGEDTEAFLDDLVNDDFSDWQLSEHSENTSETAKDHDQTYKQNLEPVSTTEDKNIEPVRKTVVEAVKREEPAIGKETSTRPNLDLSATPTPPQKRWTRFPKRVPTTPDLTHKNSSQNTDGSVEHSSLTNKDSDACSMENDILDASDLLSRMELTHNAWEDERDSNFELRHKKMENYLEHLRRDDQKKRERKMDEPFRRNSVSSVESSTTSVSSSSSSSLDMRYASACTIEELIDCKMKDVEEKFNNNICDAWVDDVELALMLIKKKSKQKNLKDHEAKELLNSILEQK